MTVLPSQNANNNILGQTWKLSVFWQTFVGSTFPNETIIKFINTIRNHQCVYCILPYFGPSLFAKIPINSIKESCCYNASVSCCFLINLSLWKTRGIVNAIMAMLVMFRFTNIQQASRDMTKIFKEIEKLKYVLRLIIAYKLRISSK